MKLYTRRGDEGRSDLRDGVRTRKDDPRFAALGTLDELNAALGLVRTAATGVLAERLAQVQHELFALGAAVAGGEAWDDTEAVARLEVWTDEWTAAAPPLTRFVLPGGPEAAARLHLARAVCRRAERTLVTLGRTSAYLNRLGDALFAAARVAAGDEETLT